MRRGVRLGIDAGSVRIGVARSDPEGLLATPEETVQRGRGDLDRLAALVRDYDALDVIVGLPTGLSGREGPAARGVREFANSLATLLHPVHVRLIDERLTTVSAERMLRNSGVHGRARRKVVDQTAAVVILQAALDVERSSGEAPGEIVQAGA